MMGADADAGERKKAAANPEKWLNTAYLVPSLLLGRTIIPKEPAGKVPIYA